MTPAKMFEGDLWVLASDAVQMAENAYKKGQAKEREACAKEADYWQSITDKEGRINKDGFYIAAAIRSRGHL
jgi:hypothetical protein